VCQPPWFLFQNRVATAQDPPSRIVEPPALEEHVNQIDVESGKIKFDDLLEIGEKLFAARWTSLDGEAILHHAGEARPQRERFAALPGELQSEIVEFLEQLQVLPNGAPREITDHQLKHLLRNQKSVMAEE
jgi:hypothetical protein